MLWDPARGATVVGTSHTLRRVVPWPSHVRAHAGRTPGAHRAARGVGAEGDTGAMPLYGDECVVLRTHKLGEADRIVTMLSRQHGKIRAVAKGVRRTASKFGSRLEPFMVVDAQFYYEGRSLDIVTQAESWGRTARRSSPTTGRTPPRAPWSRPPTD